jgi:hypothetical protein
VTNTSRAKFAANCSPDSLNAGRAVQRQDCGGSAGSVGTASCGYQNEPFKYYNNTAFQWKMVLLAGAVFSTLRLSRKPSRVLALLSLILWLGVGFSGRLIGFL